MTRIATPISEIKEHYDVIVIGSGYGGGIAASRLSRAGKQVCLLERGREIQPGEYPNTMIAATEELQVHDPDGHIGSRTGLFDLHVNAQQNVVVGCGLGGTSLINANVSLEPEPGVFEDPRWPQAVRDHRDTLLKDGYARAREMLKPNPYPNNAPNLPKLDANKKSADYLKQGAHFYKPPINVTFDKLPNNLNHVGVEQLPCNQCGDCVSGCNNKAKNTTLMNYLPDAWNHGAEIFCQAEVRHLERDGDGWIVHFQYLDSGREKFDAPTLFVKADIVVVSAGTLGSTEILLRSRDKGLVMSGQLGENMSGNGDILGFGHNCQQTINGIGFGAHSAKELHPVGPCITSIIDMRTEGDWRSRMVIEEGSIPGALGRPMVPAMAGFAEMIGVATDDSFSGKLGYKEREAEFPARPLLRRAAQYADLPDHEPRQWSGPDDSRQQGPVAHRLAGCRRAGKLQAWQPTFVPEYQGTGRGLGREPDLDPTAQAQHRLGASAGRLRDGRRRGARRGQSQGPGVQWRGWN